MGFYLQGQEENVRIEEQFRKEISAQGKLVELYKLKYAIYCFQEVNETISCA